MKVVTDKGTTLRAVNFVPNPEKAGKSMEVPLTQEEADDCAREANAKAKALGIKTRYEVKP